MLLSACGTSRVNVTTEAVERANLDANKPPPLELRPVKWEVTNQCTADNDARFMLNSRNFENLSKNTEDVQNRLHLYDNIIDKQEEFYENTIDFND